MTNAIPHADLIRAVLDGKMMQWQQPDGQWAEPKRHDAIYLMTGVWRDKKWRIKPEPKVFWLGIYEDGTLKWGYALTKEFLRPDHSWPLVKHLRIELDPDTLEVISAKTEAP